MDWKIIPIFAVLFLLLIPFAWAKQPPKYMPVFPFGADDFIMYAMTFMPSLDLTIKNLVVTGVLYANETHFTNTTVAEINVTSNMTVQDTVTAETGAFADINLGEYIYHDGDPDTYIRMEPDSMKFYVGNRFFMYLKEGAEGSVLIVDHFVSG